MICANESFDKYFPIFALNAMIKTDEIKYLDLVGRTEYSREETDCCLLLLMHKKLYDPYSDTAILVQVVVFLF